MIPKKPATTIRFLFAAAVFFPALPAAAAAASASPFRTDAAVPGAPRSLTATAGSSTIYLVWNVPESGDDPATYQVFWSPNGTQGTWTYLTSVPATTRTYTDKNLSPGVTRYYRVHATNSQGEAGAYSNTAHATTNAGSATQPRNLTATTNEASATVHLDWDTPTSSSGLVDYDIDRSRNGGTTWTYRGSTVTTETNYTDSGLVPGVVYLYRVRAWYGQSQGHGTPATTTAALTVSGVPSAPRTLTADAVGSSVIDLEWREPADPGSAAVSGYEIERRRDGSTTWTDLADNYPSTTFRDTSLHPGTTYYYRVAARNSRGRGDWSNTANATTSSLPGAPTSLTARARGASRIELDWRAPSLGRASITGYRIEVSPTGSGRWTVLEADTRDRATAYVDTELDPGTTRHYRVAAINSAGRGSWSRTAQATTDATTPGAPSRLRATPGGSGGRDRLVLTWTRPSTDGGSPITGYRVEVSRTGVSAWTLLVTTTSPTATTHTDTGLEPGSTRHYRVAAVNAKGRGAWSNTATGTTNAAAPSQPRNARAKADGPTAITLSWEPPSDNGGKRVTGYRIRRRPAESGNWTTIRSDTRSTVTTLRDTGLQPATGYRYQVAAINSVGVGAWSLEAGTQTHPDVPGAPTALVARARGTSRIDLSWRAPASTGGAEILGYRIEASSDAGRTWRTERRTTSKATAWSHTGLQPATTRHYRVFAINVAGAGPASNVARATTDATVPGVPRNLTARAQGTSRIDVSWRPPTSDGGASITGFRIEVSENAGGTWSVLVASTNASVVSYSHTGLAPASTRHYRVSAINRIGVGRASGVASATTDATVPDAPTGLTATATSPTQIDLAWVAPAYDGGAPITGYRVEVSETGTAWRDLRPNTATTTTSFAHTGLLPGSTRHYRVSAINRAGTGKASGTASASTDDPVERAARLNTTALPHIASAMTSSTVGAIADRVDAVASGMGFERRMEMGGLTSMAAMLSSPGAGQPGLGRHGRSGGATPLFAGSSFQLPLGDAGAPVQLGSLTEMAAWGAFDYQHLGEPGATALDWTGSLTSGHFGADVRVAADILAGVAASHSQGAFDFTDKTGASPVKGTYGTAMTSVNPYAAWFSGGRGNAVWASAGFGWGDVEVEDAREALRTSPARMVTGAAGGSYEVLAVGGGGVRLKAEGWAGRVMVDGGERIDSVTLDMQRAKLAVEWTQGYRSAGGDEVGMQLEGGARYDNGDGVNGVGAELGGGLRYANAGLGITVEGRGRVLISAREGYEEWGFGGMVQFDPATRGSGLSLRLAPSYGDAASGVNQLWDRGVSDAVAERGMAGQPGAAHWTRPGNRPTLDGEVAYGLPGLRGTPYGGFRLAEGGARAFSSGVRYDLGAGFGLRIEGTRREGLLGATEHTVGVRGRVRLR